MVVLLLILVSLITFAGLFAGSAWHLSKAYRQQYREDCFVPMLRPITVAKVEDVKRTARPSRRPPAMRAAA